MGQTKEKGACRLLCSVSLFFQQPLPWSGSELRHFVSLGSIDRLENFQLLAFASKDPRITLAALLQPDAVVAAAHGRAVASEAQRVLVGAWQAGDLAVGLELHGSAFTVAVDDFPAAAHIS